MRCARGGSSSTPGAWRHRHEHARCAAWAEPMPNQTGRCHCTQPNCTQGCIVPGWRTAGECSAVPVTRQSREAPLPRHLPACSHGPQTLAHTARTYRTVLVPDGGGSHRLPQTYLRPVTTTAWPPSAPPAKAAACSGMSSKCTDCSLGLRSPSTCGQGVPHRTAPHRTAQEAMCIGGLRWGNACAPVRGRARVGWGGGSVAPPCAG